MSALKALVALYRLNRRDRALVVAAVQFMEGQHLANPVQTVLDRFPCID